MQNFSNFDALNELQFHNLFSNSLFNNLPYMFWMYELVDNDYRLIKWNKNQEIYTEYSADELFHMSPLDFFEKADQENIKKAIETIFTEGKVKVFENLLTKSGKSIPFYFEGYQFNFGHRKIFIGISVDVSEHAITLEKLKLSEREKERLLIEKQKNKKELDSLTAKIIQNNIFNNKISRQVEFILKQDNINTIKEDVIKLKKMIESQHIFDFTWEVFQSSFDKVHISFFDDLKIMYPNLTKSELHFCAFLKVQIPVSDIAAILNISTDGVKKKKYRIRKKLNLYRNDSLEIFLSKI